MKKAHQAVSMLLGTYVFSKSFNIFTLSFLLFSVGNALSGIFISTFLFGINGELSVVSVFYIVFYGAECLTMYMCCKFGHIIPSRVITAVGLLLQAFGYMLLLILGESSIHWYPLISLAISLGSGMYFFAYYDSFANFSTKANRASGIAQHGLISSTASLIIPPLSGIILTSIYGKAGYAVVFSLSLIFFLLAAFNAMRLENCENSEEKTRFSAFFKRVIKQKANSFFIISQFIRGVSAGFYSYYFNILIFTITKNEFMLGINNMLTGLCYVITYFVLGKLRLKFRASMIMMFSGATVSIALLCGLLAWHTALAVIIFCALNGISTTVSAVPFEQVYYETITLNKARRENVLFRFIGLESGRVFGILITLFIPAGVEYAIPMLICFFAANLVSCVFTYFSSKDCKRIMAESDASCELNKEQAVNS